jgi:hypothetical protein
VLLTLREPGKIERGGPPFAALDERCDGFKAQVGPRGAQEQLRLVGAQGQAVDPDLRELATAAEGSDRQFREGTPGEHEERAFWCVLCEGPDGIETLAGAKQMRIVEDEDDGLAERGKRGAKPRNRARPDG